LQVALASSVVKRCEPLDVGAVELIFRYLDKCKKKNTQKRTKFKDQTVTKILVSPYIKIPL
jgi:hypothetical protein